MKSFIIMLTTFNCLILTSYFFLINVNNFAYSKQGTIGLKALGAIIFLGVVFALWQFLTKRTFIRKSFLFLSLFYFYFLYRIIMDIPDPYALTGYTISSTTGTLLFYLLGFFLGLLLTQLLTNFYSSNKSVFTSVFLIVSFAIYFFVVIFLLLKIYLTFYGSLREDLFIIEGLKNLYQRPADFLIIVMIITSFSYFLINLVLQSAFFKWIRIPLICLFLLIYLLVVWLLFLDGLMIASNKATSFIPCMGVMTILLAILIQSSSKVKNFLNNKRLYLIKFNYQLIISFIFRRLIILLFLLMLIFVLSSYLTMYFEIDFEKTRLLNYGRGHETEFGFARSLETRIKFFLDNFMIQFSYSPIFGDIYVDVKTTGRGTYSHSLPAYLLSHTGMLGFVLFFLYVCSSTKELLRTQFIKVSSKNNHFISNQMIIYSLFLIFFLFLLSILGTTVAWPPLWFSMGFVYKPLTFVPQNK